MPSAFGPLPRSALAFALMGAIQSQGCATPAASTSTAASIAASAAASTSTATSTPKATTDSKPQSASAVDTSEASKAFLAAFPGEAARIHQGLAQVAKLWRVDVDGDAATLAAFAQAQFVAGDDLERTFQRLARALEIIDGHMLEIGRDLRAPTELDLPEFNPVVAVDGVLAGWNPAAHVTSDAFATKLAFVVLLNFPQSTLEERLTAAEAGPVSMRFWAVARLTGRYGSRVPADVAATQASVGAAADAYIANYNLWMHHILGADGARLFPKGKRLISHWNLRDELKAQYANGVDGTARQRTIVRLMERIVTQTIPADVVDAPRADYNPFTGALSAADAATIETIEGTASKTNTAPLRTTPEIEVDNSRYAHLLAQFRAARAADAFTPQTPSAIQRSFELGRQLPEARVRALFLDLLRSPLVGEVAKEIQRRLDRPLEPQDLWFDGFKARSTINEASLDAKTRTRYPNAAAYKADMPRMLRALGFDKKTAAWLADHIVVDPARGAGHALEAGRRGDVPHLRTRIEPAGMDYKGYNIAVHEMGHNVEQLFSLHKVESTLLQGVPNNAFTEAIAFVFQARDLELLGIKPSSKAAAQNAAREKVLSDFWSAWEIAGVALVDVAVWHWMYDHPDATPAQLRDAVVDIAGGIWREHYAPVLGGIDADGKATPLLGIYSHMIAYPLYLTDYPVGHLIALQIEEQVERAHKKGIPLGAEIERMASIGAIAPDVWMEKATGAPVSTAPMLRATAAALAALQSSSPAPTK